MKLGVFLSTMSILDLCCLIGILVWGTINIQQSKLQYSSPWQQSTFTLISALASIMIAYILFASFYGNYRSKFVLSAIFVIMDFLAIILFGILCKEPDHMKRRFENIWNSTSEENDEIAFKIENYYSCCGFQDPIPETKYCSNLTIRCGIVLNYQIRCHSWILIIFLFLNFVINTSLIVIATMVAYSDKEIEESGNTADRWIRPLAYGFR